MVTRRTPAVNWQELWVETEQKGGNERWLFKTAKKKKKPEDVRKITEPTDGTIQGSEKDTV